MLRSSIPLFGFLTLTIACTFDTRSESVPDGSPPDSSPTDAGSDAGFSATHLLLSEIKTSDGRNLREFIEIFNPTASAIDLDEYYLADTALYARLPAILGGEPAVVAAGDFIARFPDASTIEAGGVAVVALRSNPLHPFVGADFGVEPNDATPRMVEAFPASISSVPQLENVGEGIALFRWNGASDLVEDLDLFNAGFQIPPGDALANKTGIAIDGPMLMTKPRRTPTTLTRCRCRSEPTASVRRLFGLLEKPEKRHKTERRERTRRDYRRHSFELVVRVRQSGIHRALAMIRTARAEEVRTRRPHRRRARRAGDRRS